MNSARTTAGGRFRTVADVAAWRLCIGCGACVPACPQGTVEMQNFVQDGLRPVIEDGGDCSGCNACVSACPGVEMTLPAPDPKRTISQLAKHWGPILELWEGHAQDPSLRRQGSSGGLASALALYCIEGAGMSGVAHVGNDPVLRFQNKSVFSTTRSEVLEGIGSRYSPASPCANLQAVADAGGPAAFIGKPCDVAGVRKLAPQRPDIAKNLGVAIGIFCAGTPSTQGTVDLLAQHGVDPNEIDALKYRGRGWPGAFAVRLRGSADWKDLATYGEAWGFLQKYRPYRCYLCPDSTSEFADIACGDPWYREPTQDDPGSSLVLVRTEAGRKLLRGAMQAGYVSLRAVTPETLDHSQRELQRKRGAIWGRLIALRTLGVPAPRIRGFHLFHAWLGSPMQDKARSVIGTLRRVIMRGYRRPMAMPRQRRAQ